MLNHVWFFVIHGLQPERLLCRLLSPRVCSNSRHWVSDTIQPSHPVTPISSSQYFSASESFPVSELIASVGQSIGATTSASVLLMKIQGSFPLKLTGLISLQNKGLSGVFCSITIWKHLFISVHPSLWTNSQRPSELVNLVIIFMISILKNYCFKSMCARKPSPLTMTYCNLAHYTFISRIETFIFFSRPDWSCQKYMLVSKSKLCLSRNPWLVQWSFW